MPTTNKTTNKSGGELNALNIKTRDELIEQLRSYADFLDGSANDDGDIVLEGYAETSTAMSHFLEVHLQHEAYLYRVQQGQDVAWWLTKAE